jgi:hypothetical protein
MQRLIHTLLLAVGLLVLTSCSESSTPAQIAKPQLSEAEQKLADEAADLYSKKKMQKDNICEEFYKLQSDDKYNSWKQISMMLKEYSVLDPSTKRFALHSKAYYENQLTPYYERIDSNGRYLELPEEYFFNGEWVIIRDLEDFCNRS